MAGESGNATTGDTYGCETGDAFVDGQLNGAVTVAADNYVYVTGDLTYTDSNDMLGLVGNQSVLVWNPIDKNTNTLLTDNGRTIDAAIISVLHSFAVQNYDVGADRGTLNVKGAIAQKYRGIVRQFNSGGPSGYAKNYVYDTRFQYAAPPKYLSPTTTTFAVTRWVEVTPTAFDSTGLAQ
jgi:hypothetical protein